MITLTDLLIAAPGFFFFAAGVMFIHAIYSIKEQDSCQDD